MAATPRLPLNTLRAFEAVGRHCHVRRAADELHLTHAALSRQIRVLEEQLGTRLFDREKNRMQLTAAGRRFLSVVQTALDSLAEGVLQLNPESLAGDLVVAVTPTMSVNWLPGIISAYSQRYPEVELHFVTIEPHQRKLPQRFDLALCLGPPQEHGREVRKLYQEYYFPVAAPSLEEIDKPINKPLDLLQYPLLHERFQHWEEWFTLQGVDRARGARNIHFDYGFQSIEAARAGLGIVLADQLEVAADLRRGSLVRLLDEVLPVDDGVYLVCDPPEAQTVRARLFIEELNRYLDELGVQSRGQT
jgi:LysR family transcriptional regulator, glycine cleavage system transcriptional activator